MRFTVKLGGSILEDADIRRALLAQVAELERDGHEVILVHGGGKSLNRRLGELQISSRFVDGLRVTDAETLAVAVMVLAGEVNKTLVAEMQALGSTAIGICGADGAAVRCRPLAGSPGYPDELGFVGQPISVNRSLFKLLLGGGLVPVVSSIAYGDDGQLYNVNADQMASVCAWGTGCESLVYLTDVPGVQDDAGEVIRARPRGRSPCSGRRARSPAECSRRRRRVSRPSTTGSARCTSCPARPGRPQLVRERNPVGRNLHPCKALSSTLT